MNDEAPGPNGSLDLLVLGSGVAGLSAAVRAADTHGMRVGVLTKGELQQSTTRWAQGGVAAVLGEDPDSTDLHLADTLRAGAGLCDVDAVRVLVDEGPGRVNGLIALGAMFDRDERGQLELAREGGHSLARVVHAGGAATGLEIERALVEAVRSTAAALHENAFAASLIIENGRCRGAVAIDADGARRVVRADHVLLATGGAGQLFSVTTNPIEATGDGVAMALRAGVAVADVEFIQFHPTALHHPRMPRPLLSEALRGHGALLRDVNGERFVDELLPRDEVSRAMTRRMIQLGVDHCLLDATGLEHFDERFPTISSALAEAGLDPTSDWLPIAPAAHHLSGGVVTDLDGASAMPHLWAAGEVACSGVHGANRLASNSLLEGMVFAFRVVEAIERGKTGAEPTGAMRAVLGDGQAPTEPSTGGGGWGRSAIPGLRIDGWAPVAWPSHLGLDRPRSNDVPESQGDSAESGAAGTRSIDPNAVDLDACRDRLQRAMTSGAGVLRSAGSLAETAAIIELVEKDLFEAPDSPGSWEVRNLVDLATAVVCAGTYRQESRGAHTRRDFPDLAEDFKARIILDC